MKPCYVVALGLLSGLLCGCLWQAQVRAQETPSLAWQSDAATHNVLSFLKLWPLHRSHQSVPPAGTAQSAHLDGSFLQREIIPGGGHFHIANHPLFLLAGAILPVLVLFYCRQFLLRTLRRCVPCEERYPMIALESVATAEAPSSNCSTTADTLPNSNRSSTADTLPNDTGDKQCADLTSFGLLLKWLRRDGVYPAKPPLAAGFDEDGIRGLYVTRDVFPGELLLALPYQLCLMSRKSSATEALAEGALMAVQLLQDRVLWRRHGKSRWGPLHDALPSACVTPPLQFNATEIQAIEDKFTIEQAKRLRWRAEQSWAQVKDDLHDIDHDDFLWALSIISSRFFQKDESSDVHAMLPLLDFANHSFSPSCHIQHRGSTRAELLAGDGGLRQGDQVTVCYGEWPTEAFFLFFGFVPSSNPYDDIVLFGDAADLADEYLALIDNMEYTKEELIGIIEEACEGDAQRMFMTPQGLDGRIMCALSELEVPTAEAFELLIHRCNRLQQQYSTTIIQDEELLQSSSLSANEKLAIQYRLSRKRMLENVTSFLKFHLTSVETKL